MTVREIIDFLSKYDGEIPVYLTKCATDNPMTDDIAINEIVAITSSADGMPHLVVMPTL